MIGANITTSGIGGSTGSVDNVALRSDGTGGSTAQNSGLVIEDTIVSFTTVTGDAGTDVITATGSDFTNGQPVRFTALTGGSGLNTTTNYFVREVSGATFKVETSIGGGAINFTTNITAGTLLTGHSVQANVALSLNTTETNSSLALQPKGNGAFCLAKPNGLASGGNARGQFAVDLQVGANFRVLATQVASGNYSFATSYGNTASNTSAHAMGAECTASGNTSFTLGYQCQATTNSFPIAMQEGTAASGRAALSNGINSSANRYAMQAHAGGQFSAQGDAQRARFVLRCKTTTNAAVEMALDGSTTYLTIPSGKVMFMNIKVVGTKSDGAAVATYERQYAVKNVAGTSSQAYAPITIGTDNAAGTSLAVATVDAGDYVSIKPTGVLNETWRWVASVDAVEVAYGT